MTTITVSNNGEVVGLVPRILGFVPTESLVILGQHGAPTARLDLPTSAAEREGATKALAPCLPHWLELGVIVIGYTDHRERFESVELDAVLPGVPVIASLLASDYAPMLPDGAEELSEPLQSRAELAAEAECLIDGPEALRAAWAAYRSGDGTRAWCYIDRAVQLGTDCSELAELLAAAVPPERV